MKRQGAEIVEGVNIAEIDQIPPSKLACDRFKYAIPISRPQNRPSIHQ
jgi:hypothetical protein